LFGDRGDDSTPGALVQPLRLPLIHCLIGNSGSYPTRNARTSNLARIVSLDSVQVLFSAPNKRRPLKGPFLFGDGGVDPTPGALAQPWRLPLIYCQIGNSGSYPTRNTRTSNVTRVVPLDSVQALFSAPKNGENSYSRWHPSTSQSIGGEARTLSSGDLTTTVLDARSGMCSRRVNVFSEVMLPRILPSLAFT